MDELMPAIVFAGDAERKAKAYADAVHTPGWNQLTKNGNFADTTNWSARSNCTISASNHELTITCTAAGSLSVEQALTFNPAHKYFLSCQAKITSSLTNVQFGATIAGGSGADFGETKTITANYNRIESIASASRTQVFSSLYLSTSSTNVGDVITVKNVMCIDLTALFGAGNEPSSVDAFRAMFPADYYPYCSGSFADLLWTNASPTSAFAGQSVSLNLSEYSFVIVVFRTSISSAYYSSILAAINSKPATFMMKDRGKDDGYIVIRTAWMYPDSISFGSASYMANISGTGASNDYAIPYQIYGVR